MKSVVTSFQGLSGGSSGWSSLDSARLDASFALPMVVPALQSWAQSDLVTVEILAFHKPLEISMIISNFKFMICTF